ncbi:hypothetical protein HYW46_00885 [Candidatus Daviesbacteria bacterium]|nr:hypothetical protein [Candidatus Daviesbacteria bacterium]
MYSKLTAVLAIFFSFLAFIPKPVFAAPGTLDLSFGTNGIVSTEFSADPDATDGTFALAASLQPDGKIVAGGFGFTGTDWDFAVARYNPDGSLDTTFDNDGKVMTSFGSTSEILALKIQEDGKIVATGDVSSTTTTSDFGLVRYNSDGSLDSTFGMSGKVTTDFGGSESPQGLVILNDGKIMVAGNKDENFMLVRYNSNGTLDTTFGTNGYVVTDFGGVDGATSLLLQSDGKLVAGGYNGTDFASTRFAAARYNSDGSLDTSFGTGGKVTTDFGATSIAFSSVLQNDGKIILAGDVRLANLDFALVRYNTDGSLDTGFGNGGKVITDFNNTDEELFAIGIQTDGKILGTGMNNGLNGTVFALVRYNMNGMLDTDFGTAGKVTAELGTGDNAQAFALAIQTDGQVVVSGIIFNGPKATFGLARFNTSTLENVIQTVSAGGSLTSDSENDGATSVDPIETTVTSPTGGEVSISEITPSLQPPSGYSFLGSQVNITAPAATAENPLQLVFVLDSTVVAGADVSTIQVLKNTVPVPPCLGSPGVASPDPCVSSRTLLADGDAQITALTSTASSWNLALQTNSAPQLSLTSPSVGQLYALGDVVNLQASFTDSNSSDTHTCDINWDDGSNSQGVVVESKSSCGASHSFGSAGVYTINTTLTDSQGAADAKSVMVVVYDPSAGFVTGGGWLNSPAGAYTADLGLAGVANFGFVAKYQKGTNLPTGQTEFQFKVAGFNFHSDSYEWLVVAGSKAQYKGSGSVNGVSGYNFLLTATDGETKDNPDKFRIKITKGSQVVYDNALGASDDIDSANPQELGGGSIIIHK